MLYVLGYLVELVMYYNPSTIHILSLNSGVCLSHILSLSLSLIVSHSCREAPAIAEENNQNPKLAQDIATPSSLTRNAFAQGFFRGGTAVPDKPLFDEPVLATKYIKTTLFIYHK